MADDSGVKIEVRGIKELQALFKSVPRGTTRAAIKAATDYLVGDDRHGLKHYPNRVMHGKINPYQWQSERQRKAYFATDGFGGGIPSKRTNKLKDGWQMRMTSNGYKMHITNKTPYVHFVMGKWLQRGHIADKWRTADAVIQSNLAGAFREVHRAVARWLKEHKK